MNVVNKDVKYLNKDFGQFRQNLITFAKQYFPCTYNDFNESSPGMMFIEMASYVGDVLSFYTDQTFRESMLTQAVEDANVLSLSQMFGYKPKLSSPSIVDLDVYQLVPAIGTGINARPDMRYALVIDEGMLVETDSTSGGPAEPVKFRTLNKVDFTFSSSLDPMDVSVYEIDNTGDVQFYLLKKSVQAVSGQVITKTFPFTTPKPYDKIALPETNVLDIISITDDDGYIWYQVDYLAQDTIFEDIINIPYNDQELAAYRSTTPYILKLKTVPRRFVTRLRQDNRTEIQFGSGISAYSDMEIIPNPKNVGLGLDYLKRTTLDNLDPTNFLYTSTYGLAPSNVTLTVQYSIGGGIKDNVGLNTITKITNITYNTSAEIYGLDLTSTKASVAITNPAPATGGKSKESVDNIRQNALAAFAAQNRAITREDYIARTYAMPNRYGSIAKAYIIGDSQVDTSDVTYPRDTISNPLALNLYVLAYDGNKNLTVANPATKENLRTYLSNYRMLTDAINIKDAYIVNIGIEFEVIPVPNANSNEVILTCINRLKELFEPDRMQINAGISISNIISELDVLYNVQSIPRLEIVNLFDMNKGYSGNVYDIQGATKNNIVYPSLDPCIFEVKYPNVDIKGRVVKP
jgi:hypothetical protein